MEEVAGYFGAVLFGRQSDSPHNAFVSSTGKDARVQLLLRAVTGLRACTPGHEHQFSSPAHFHLQGSLQKKITGYG